MQASSTDLKHVRAPAKSEERQETLHFFQVAFHRTSTHFFIEKTTKTTVFVQHKAIIGQAWSGINDYLSHTSN
jgi:hypothetical protein